MAHEVPIHEPIPPMSRIAHSVKKHVRRSAPKSRNGCVTCKTRRVKCDETRPHCLQCTRGGRTCGGYQAPQPRKAVKDRDNTISKYGFQEQSLVATTASYLPTLNVRIDEYDFMSLKGEERRFFYIFHLQAATQIGGAHDTDFWNRLVLQACYHDPAIRHAAIAMGALFEQVERGSSDASDPRDSDVVNVFALQQYSRAINMLLKPVVDLGHQTTDVALVTCILFTCFELLRGHIASAISHIRNGTKMLLELEDTGRRYASQSPGAVLVPSTTPYVPVQHLRRIMERLDVQAAMMTHEPVKLWGTPDSTERPREICADTSFVSFDAAYRSLDLIWHDVSGWMQLYSPGQNHALVGEKSEAYYTHRAQLLASFRQWSHAFEELKQRFGGEILVETNMQVRLLQLQNITVELSLHMDYVRMMSDRVYAGTFCMFFREIVHLAEPLVEMMAGDGSRAKTFILGFGIIVPLAIVARYSADAVLRHKATALIKRSRRQEGLWDSQMVAKGLEKVQELEELGQAEAEDSPGNNRLAEIVTRIIPEGERGVVVFRGKSANEAMVQVQEELKSQWEG